MLTMKQLLHSAWISFSRRTCSCSAASSHPSGHTTTTCSHIKLGSTPGRGRGGMFQHPVGGERGRGEKGCLEGARMKGGLSWWGKEGARKGSFSQW